MKDNEITRYVFFYPDTRPQNEHGIIAEGFTVRPGDVVNIDPKDDAYVFTLQTFKTVLVPADKSKGRMTDTTVAEATGRTKTVRVRPVYLWVEIETLPAAGA
jgi:hypothetical protein